jgi:hypothetical protein
MGGANIIASANGRPLTDYWFKFIYDSSNILISPWTLVNNYFNSFIVDASNKAISKGVFSTDAMPIQQNHPMNTTNVRGNSQSNANSTKSG